ELVAGNVGPAHRDAGALVAREAEALLLVAARAARVVLSGRNRVHRDPVVRVDLSGAHFAVVAVGAVALGVAIGAEGGVVGGDALVAVEPVGGVLRVHEPARRL